MYNFPTGPTGKTRSCLLTRDPEFQQSTVLVLECNKESIIRGPLQIALPGKQFIDSQFFLSEQQHEQILIGHPACDQLGVYTLNVNNIAHHLNISKLLPPFCGVNSVETQQGTITDAFHNITILILLETLMVITVRPAQHPMRKNTNRI